MATTSERGLSPENASAPQGLIVGCLTLVVAVAATLALLSYDVDPWGAIGLPLVLTAVTVPLLLRTKLASIDGLGGILVAGLLAKFAGALLRHIVVYEWYDGGADALRYLSVGGGIAEEFRSGRVGITELIPTSRGTAFVEELSGLSQAVVGSSPIANFMVFGWLAFLGMVAMVSAARIAIPDVQVRRYTILVLFLPSMLFWPSSVGKDAWMIFTLGLFCLGAAKVFARRWDGIPWLVIGGTGMTYVRPHLAIIAFAAFGIAVVLGRRRRSGVARGTSLGLRAMGVALLVVGFSFAISQASGLIPGFEPDGTVDLNETLTETQRRSSQGGSEIEVTAPNILPEYPLAFITVMFRPLPFEVTNFNALLAATESTVLIVLFVLWRRQVGDGVRRAFREPYLMMAGLYTLAFGLAWASVGNLGIIARQRVQVLPLLVLFLCVPALAGRRLRSNQQDALPQAAERAH